MSAAVTNSRLSKKPSESVLDRQCLEILAWFLQTGACNSFGSVVWGAAGDGAEAQDFPVLHSAAVPLDLFCRVSE